MYMPEIIPNYHPFLVHFTIALLSISVLFYLLRLLLPINHHWKEQWLNMANWSLWTGCLFAIMTAIAGWLAYNSVAHDGPSHAAMTLHRNWALPTATLFLVLGVVSINLARKTRVPGFKFLSVSFIAVILLLVTGWLGSEAVYRYGLGVLSLPKVEAGSDGHNHSHGMEPDAIHQPDDSAVGSEQGHLSPTEQTDDLSLSTEKSHSHPDAIIRPDTVDAMKIIISDENNVDEHKHVH
jgi:uncharacterized membrane protein